MSTHRNSPRRRIASKRIRRLVADTLRVLRLHHADEDVDAANRQLRAADRKRGVR